MNRCDFCGRTPASRRYDAGSEIFLRTFIESGPEAAPAMGYARIWAACDRCGDFVDRKDFAGLQEAVKQAWEQDPDLQQMMRDPEGRKMVLDMLATLYGELARRPLVRIR